MKNAGEILFTQIVIIVNVEVFTVLSTASTLEAIVMYIYMYKQTGHWTSTGKKIAVLRKSIWYNGTAPRGSRRHEKETDTNIGSRQEGRKLWLIHKYQLMMAEGCLTFNHKKFY